MGDWEVRLIGSGGTTEREAAGIAALLRGLVADGAALGWVAPPSAEEVGALIADLVAGVPAGDTASAVAVAFTAGGDEEVAGFGYWRRYRRPTHRPHADLEELAVAPGRQGLGLGRALLSTLIAAALRQGVEVLTLDVRGGNTRAEALAQKLGFHQYGRLENFVAVGDARHDKLFYALDLRELRGPAAS
ncbi:GNAT family N-acetyltransferase [Actinoplanes sp. NEAU-A12]|uniref:GNAT family N-acetyltransferase n=1 Tax=Actinoplanes sandaracinus TaxID=3045177 RepID=A0ABT6WYT2_9ACTN|nr:GNAT family N-acetyltransferase [Actinoplanes sandaracinus]MDI6104894.1 GNAT family N-acetyltransferase [Actinoplanes sandaracinus]